MSASDLPTGCIGVHITSGFAVATPCIRRPSTRTVPAVLGSRNRPAADLLPAVDSITLSTTPRLFSAGAGCVVSFARCPQTLASAAMADAVQGSRRQIDKELFMSRPKVPLAVLIAILTVSVFASAVASASASLPEIDSSHYPFKYASTISGAATWEEGPTIVKCTGATSTIEGEVTGAKTMTAVIMFRGCKAGGAWCNMTATKGELVTQPLEGTLAYVNKATRTPGIVFKPRTGMNVVGRFSCDGVSGEVTGAVIALLTGVYNGEKTTRVGFRFQGSKGKQLPEAYDNEAGEEVHASMETNWPSYPFAPLSWNFEAASTLAEEVEWRF